MWGLRVSALGGSGRWVGTGWPQAWALFWDPSRHGLPWVRPPAVEAKLRFHLKVKTPRSQVKGHRLPRASDRMAPAPHRHPVSRLNPARGWALIGHTPTLTVATEHTQKTDTDRGLFSHEAGLGALGLGPVGAFARQLRVPRCGRHLQLTYRADKETESPRG